MKMTKEEGNKIIAEFMEFSHSHEYYDFDGKHEVKYHKSWDWLMPVVEKIEGLIAKDSFDNDAELIISIEKHLCFIATKSERELKPFIQVFLHENSKIEIVWQAVIQFIQWYNQQTKPA